MQLGIELLNALQINLRESLGSEISCFNPTRELRNRSEGNVRISSGQRTCVVRAAYESILFRHGLNAKKRRVPLECRSKSRLQFKLAGTGAPLVKSCHGFAPSSGCQITISRTQFELHKFLGVGESWG